MRYRDTERTVVGLVAFSLLLVGAPTGVTYGELLGTEKSEAPVVESVSVTVKPAPAPEKSPGTAVLLSAVFPGGGQVYTGNWWKACLIAPAEVTLAALTVRDHIDATQALAAGNEAEYVRLRNRRNAFGWWTGAVLAFSMADAYVSAQMYGFDQQMKFTLGPMRVGIVAGF